MKEYYYKSFVGVYLLLLLLSCKNRTETNSSDVIASMDLKQGALISCGPAENQFGTISFSASIPGDLREDFNTGVALLHSFEYDEAEKTFANIIKKNPDIPIAYWGVAMANFHPLWASPTPAELKKGSQAAKRAQLLDKKTKREADYINAIAKFYEDTAHLSHKERVINFEKAMEGVYLNYRDDKEASVFYALALNAAADPTDKAYSRQKKAFAILNEIFQRNPLHPGIAHYIIHNYDYPELAALALPAARKYASIAPASSHAQHMPSHIFTRLGLWDEVIQSNKVAASSAKCYAEQAKMKGHWDEELHALDYLLYGHLQKGEDDLAQEQIAYLKTIKEVYPVSSKVLYAFAAMPARYYLERKLWSEAAAMETPTHLPWEKFSWQKAIIHFTRALGFVHLGKTDQAKTELEDLKSLHQVLVKQKNSLREAAQVEVQINAAAAWIEHQAGNNAKALALMNTAADMEDATEKHPVTPGEVIPARELLADMLLKMNQPEAAFKNYKEVLRTHTNRFNALYGAAVAAKQIGYNEEAKTYFNKLVAVATDSKRKELKEAKSFAG